MKINYTYELASKCINECMGSQRWGKAELSRYMRSAKDILQYFSESPLLPELEKFRQEEIVRYTSLNLPIPEEYRKPITAFDMACRCIESISLWLKSKSLDWSMEGSVVKNRGKWEQHIQKYGRFNKEIFG